MKQKGIRDMEKTTILLIEDDEDIREGVRILLESEQYEVLEAGNGRDGIAALNDQVDLVILDIMMPGISGLKTCEEIRKISYVPILFLTAKASESDKLVGLMAGGDDYLAKPFSYAELLGRVKALIRRYQIYSGKKTALAAGTEDSFISIGNIRMNENRNEAWVDEEEIKLTEIEYKILLLMMRYPKKTFSAKNLYESVWNEPYYYSSNSTIMVHIRKLRTKIEKTPETPTHIVTVWGKGYRFE